MSWLGRISQNRTQAQGQQPLRRPGGPKADPAKLADTLASDKVVAKHGAALAPAAGDMQAIAACVQGLEAHRARQFGNAVDQFYSALGRSTEDLAPPQREPVIKASMSAMRQAVEKLAHHPALIPAMTALTSLLEPRGAHGMDPAAHADAAKQQVLDLVERFEARQGTGSVLFGFRNLVESYEAGQDDLTAKARPAIWAAVTDYLDAVVPRPGCDQGQLGTITGLFTKGLRKTPDDPKAAIASATEAALAPLADARRATLEQLEVEPPNIHNLPENAPQRVAHAAMRDALRQIVEDNPAGPEALLAAVEQAQGKLAQVAQAGDADVAAAYKGLARILEISGRTSAAIPVLEHVAQNIPTIVTHAPSRAVIQRAARMQKAESVAPLLVQAHLARLNRTPEQMKLVEALEKLGRLPPGPSLRAAVALLPQVQQAHAGPLAEALFVESRTAESSEALDEFVRRFATAFGQLRNLGDGAGPVAAALARSGTGNVDARVAASLANLVTRTKQLLPETPRTKLLDRGKNGEPGLIALANAKDFIHDPIPIAQALLQAVAEARPNQEAVPEARLALRIAAEVARFDRNPAQTDLPKIKEDFAAALKSPGSLTPAKGAGPEATKSAAAFAAAHPDFPIEVLFTAARAFDGPRMNWLAGELSSTRSHAYARVLRDAVYAAARTQHAYFFDVLRNAPADRAAKEAAATAIAMDHRQGHAANAPWDALIDGLQAGEDPVARLQAEKAAEAMRAIGLDGIEAPDVAGMEAISRSKKQLQALLDFFSKDQYGKPKDFFLEPLMTAVRAHADGSWPSPKYDSDIAKEHLAPLRPEQLAAWKANTATGANAPAAPIDDPEQVEASLLLQGVAKTLTDHVRVDGSGFEDVKWDRASLDALRGRQADLLAKLRDAKKGSPEHRAASKEIGPIAQRVALLELHDGLKSHFAGDEPPPDPAAALRELQPLAAAAIGPLRKQRASGFVHALETAAAAVKPAPAGNARTGRYACDDDGLDAYLTAFGGGCIHPENGFNRGSLVELISGSQYKMIRAMRDDKPVGRSFLRLVRVEMSNGYQGMALRMDPPQASSAGSPSGEDKALMYKHALRKAVSMGVPLLVSDANAAGPAAKEMGLDVTSLKSKTFVHRGVTGMHHNQGMWSADYFIMWPGIQVGQGGPKATEEQREVGRDYSFQVVMPPDWKA